MLVAFLGFLSRYIGFRGRQGFCAMLASLLIAQISTYGVLRPAIVEVLSDSTPGDVDFAARAGSGCPKCFSLRDIPGKIQCHLYLVLLIPLSSIRILVLQGRRGVGSVCHTRKGCTRGKNPVEPTPGSTK